MQDLDKTYVYRSNPIDALAVSEGLIDCSEGSKLLTCSEVARTNYRAYLVDVDIGEHFNEDFSSYE